MAEQIKVKCSRCKGTGQATNRTGRFDATCFCCRGKGFFYRKAPTKRKTDQDIFDDLNARLAALFPKK